MQYSLICVLVMASAFSSSLILCRSSVHVQTSLCELGTSCREWLCLHSSQELAALGVFSPESGVSGGFNLCFTLRCL